MYYKKKLKSHEWNREECVIYGRIQPKKCALSCINSMLFNSGVPKCLALILYKNGLQLFGILKKVKITRTLEAIENRTEKNASSRTDFTAEFNHKNMAFSFRDNNIALDFNSDNRNHLRFIKTNYV